MQEPPPRPPTAAARAPVCPLSIACLWQAENEEYPPRQLWASRPGEAFFCSLGNSHFFQALNLVGT